MPAKSYASGSTSGLDEVGLPTGEEGGEQGEAFSLGDMFNKVKKWVVDNDDKVIQVVVPWLKKQLKKSTQGMTALEMPNSTPITAMISPSLVPRLSPALKRLTRQDLLALGGWGVPRKTLADLGLGSKDLQTIRDIFTPRLVDSSSLDEDDPDAWSISCCSCTPCCCAAAVTQPLRAVA